MKKANKGITVLLVILILICLIGGGLGLYKSFNKTEKKPDEEIIEYTITYEYYLDDEKVEQMPINEEISQTTPSDDNSTSSEESKEDLYEFEKYSCTNRVTGTWDNEKWQFIPNKTSDARCALYFTSNYYIVDVTAVNAEVNTLETFKVRTVKKGETIDFSITPTDGFKFDKVTCTENATGTWNEEKQILTISEITKNTTCEISFIKNEYLVGIDVNNGSLTEITKNTVEHGQSLSFTVIPSNNYEFSTVTCTNDQKATYDKGTNKLTVSNVTKETKCTINFTLKKHSVQVTINNGTTISTNPQEVSEGKSATFVISPSAGYTNENATIKCTNGQNAQMNTTDNILTILNVTADTTCTVTLKEESTSTE